MTARELLTYLRNQGTVLQLEDARLRYRGSKQTMTEEILESMKLLKPELLELLEAETNDHYLASRSGGTAGALNHAGDAGDV